MLAERIDEAGFSINSIDKIINLCYNEESGLFWPTRNLNL